jgi:hypothetical protein
MINRLLRRVAVLGLVVVAGPALAGVVSFSGNLGDRANGALVASDLSAALFDFDQDTANNVALYALHVSTAGSAGFASTGFVPGGIDPYFSIFSGTDRATATFVESNYFFATATGGDFAMTVPLAAGDYTVAIGVYTNLSYAENLGSGFLADGFIGLGDPQYLRNGSYALTVTLPDAGTVPEPSGALLALTAASAALWARRRRPAQATNGGR